MSATVTTSPAVTAPNGDITPYGFMCGYVQSWCADGSCGYYSTDAPAVALYADGGCYHVRVRTMTTGRGERVDGVMAGWDSFDTLSEARAAYRRAVRALTPTVSLVKLYNNHVVSYRMNGGRFMPVTLRHTVPSMVEAYASDIEAPLSRTATGYGAKLATRYRIRYAGVWRRVYTANWGNSGSAYVAVKGTRVYLDDDTSYALSDGYTPDHWAV